LSKLGKRYGSHSRAHTEEETSLPALIVPEPHLREHLQRVPAKVEDRADLRQLDQEVSRIVKRDWHKFDSNGLGYLDKEQARLAVKTMMWDMKGRYKFNQLGFILLIHLFEEKGAVKLTPANLEQLTIGCCTHVQNMRAKAVKKLDSNMADRLKHLNVANNSNTKMAKLTDKAFKRFQLPFDLENLTLDQASKCVWYILRHWGEPAIDEKLFNKRFLMLFNQQADLRTYTVCKSKIPIFVTDLQQINGKIDVDHEKQTVFYSKLEETKQNLWKLR
jgi:hypothetical protein